MTIEQSGSLHYASETEQDEDTVSDTNTVIFTSKAEIRPFNLIGPNELYIGERDDIRLQLFVSGAIITRRPTSGTTWAWRIQSYMEPLIVEDPAGWVPDLFVTNCCRSGSPSPATCRPTRRSPAPSRFIRVT